MHVKPLAFCMLVALLALPASDSPGGRCGQDASRRIRDGRNRLRSAGDRRQLLVHVSATHLRSALHYDYFARPPRLVPNTAAAMPEITDGGRTFTIRVKPGIFFADDPAFKGKPRELTADDYVVQHQAHASIRASARHSLFIFEQQARRSRRSARRCAGARASSITTRRSKACRSSIATRCASASGRRITSFSLADLRRSPSAVAREVVEQYQDASHRVMEHPVGTGAYRLKEWNAGTKIVLRGESRHSATSSILRRARERAE